VVAPVTSTVRSVPTEVRLGVEEDLPVECAASFDNLQTINRAHLVHRLGALSPARRGELCAVLRALADC
jgi:mRNA interferase MazF